MTELVGGLILICVVVWPLSEHIAPLDDVQKGTAF